MESYETMSLDEVEELLGIIVRLNSSSKNTLRAIANERFGHSTGSTNNASRKKLIEMIENSVSNERAHEAIERLASKPLNN